MRNPGNPAIAAQGDGWVQLAWKPVYKPYLSHYNVYTTTNASIAGVSGGADTRLMILAGRASSESLKVAVENGRDTYLAVTAVNKSDGEDPQRDRKSVV